MTILYFSSLKALYNQCENSRKAFIHPPPNPHSGLALVDACLTQKPPVRMALGSISRASLTLRQDRSLAIRETLGSRGLSPQSHLLFMGQGVLSKDRISET